MISLLRSNFGAVQNKAYQIFSMAMAVLSILCLAFINVFLLFSRRCFYKLAYTSFDISKVKNIVQQKSDQLYQDWAHFITRQKQLCHFVKKDKTYVQRAGIVSFSFMLVLLSGMFHLIEPLSAHSQKQNEEILEPIDITAKMMDDIETASGNEFSIFENAQRNEPEEVLELETILVPKKNTVISSSRDGKIRSINVNNGDLFQKGDTLIQYDCRDVEAEIIATRSEASLSKKKALRSAKLFKLEIISDVENIELDTEQKKAEANFRALEQRLDSCSIKAEYNGRVTNRLANPGEYTRTDRVLMEVASLDDLNAEFLMPSIWLRWVNVGAPVTIKLHETGESYEADIIRFYGEVDPASQSIQVTARLKTYDVPLLPGMSGVVAVNKDKIMAMDMTGYLQTKRAH